MRGAFEDQGGLFSYISPEARVPTSHPLRKIRELVREVLGDLNRSLGKLYASEGRPSIPPEQLLSASLAERRGVYEVHDQLHVASTALLTFYRVCVKRGSLLANVAGIVVHGHWKPYYMMQGVRHALSNVHHTRELKALVEIEKEEWAPKMQRLLRLACHAANRAGERSVPMKPRHIECLERRYDAILAEGLVFHEAQAPLAPAAMKGGGKRRGRPLHHAIDRHFAIFARSNTADFRSSAKSFFICVARNNGYR